MKATHSRKSVDELIKIYEYMITNLTKNIYNCSPDQKDGEELQMTLLVEQWHCYDFFLIY